jgi:hypothetical protein
LTSIPHLGLDASLVEIVLVTKIYENGQIENHTLLQVLLAFKITIVDSSQSSQVQKYQEKQCVDRQKERQQRTHQNCSKKTNSQEVKAESIKVQNFVSYGFKMFVYILHEHLKNAIQHLPLEERSLFVDGVVDFELRAKLCPVFYHQV